MASTLDDLKAALTAESNAAGAAVNRIAELKGQVAALTAQVADLSAKVEAAVAAVPPGDALDAAVAQANATTQALQEASQ